MYQWKLTALTDKLLKNGINLAASKLKTLQIFRSVPHFVIKIFFMSSISFG